MEVMAINTVAAAFTAGLVTSVHCAGMCGPLACSAMPGTSNDAGQLAAASAYHLTRILAYTLIGALAGLLGTLPMNVITDSPAKYLPWALCAVFLLYALGLDKRLPKPKQLGKLLFKIRLKLAAMSRIKAGVAIGALTPFLPCGPLYLIFGLALISGSPVRGAEFTLAFGLGTIPLLWAAQTGFSFLRGKLNPAMIGRIQRGVAFCAAALIAWRMRGTLGFYNEAGGDFLCH